MDTTNIVYIIVMVVLVILSGIFSAAETAFSTMNRTKLKTAADKGDKKSKNALLISENYDKLISTILVGNNLVNIALTSIATIFFVGIVKDQGKAATLTTVVATVVVLIFGEVSPKSLAKEAPESYALAITPFIRFLMFIFTPVTALFVLWKKLLSKIFKFKDDKGMTSDEFITLIDSVEKEGDIDSEESELLRSAVEFNDQEAQDILTPRVDIVGVEDDSTMENIARVFTDTGFSRLPVWHDNVDNIIGIVHQKDFYDGPVITRKKLKQIMKPPVYVTPTMKIRDILKQLQSTKSHIAVVTDEYGGTLGIVTMEDILEELVGEIWDEHDEVIEDFRQESEDTYIVRGSASLDEMFETFDIAEDIEADSISVSGWVMEKIGRIPEVGDEFSYKNLDVSVEAVENNRVMEVRIVVNAAEEDEEADDRDKEEDE